MNEESLIPNFILYCISIVYGDNCFIARIQGGLKRLGISATPCRSESPGP